ncbi:MAG TPA: ABC transporter permease [Burkholderiales bacterium]|jgi:ABC-type transport system involved in multi-copper enzyme maturation permease subunit|nr:ABC transporter permease [Burkholderiales bacterium]
MIWLVGVLLVVCLGLAGFLQQVAIIESAQIQGAVLAAVLRTCAAFLTAAFVAMSMAREFNDKVFELMLAQPWPRGVYLAGKFVGFSTAAVALALVLSLPLIPFVPLDRLAVWSLSLACELVIVAAMSLFCAITLTHVVPALATVLGFYFLARSIAAIQIIAASAEESIAWTDRLANGIVKAIAVILPRLDLMTRSDWLVGAAPALGTLGGLVGQAVLYTLLLLAAAQFDLHRQNF